MTAAAWPAPTPPPSPPRHRRRQTIADQSQVDASLTQCQVFSGNDVISCFPTADTVIPQHQWASFVWNSRRPDLTQTNLVDIFLFRADSNEQILHLPKQPNPSDQAGSIRQQVNDSWFGVQGESWAGANVSFPFFWVIIRSDKTLDGNQIPQPIFTAVQTTVLDSVAAAQTSASLASASSASLASASAAAASLSSLSAAASASSAASVSRTATSTSTATGNVQHASATSSFPRWAIAVIVVLGFLAIAATCLLAFLILRRLRRRRAVRSRSVSSRGSMGSASPMIAHPAAEREMTQRYDVPPSAGIGSPLLPPQPPHQQSTLTHDGASTISDSGGPFSGADAAIMADAFRKMLRKPDFAGRPVEEGESPDTPPGDDKLGSDAAPGHGAVLSRELAEEGRDIRSVSSSRGVKVERTDHDPELPGAEER